MHPDLLSLSPRALDRRSLAHIRDLDLHILLDEELEGFILGRHGGELELGGEGGERSEPAAEWACGGFGGRGSGGGVTSCGTTA